MLFREKNVYQYWLGLYRNFPKPERFGLGEKIDILFLELLEKTYNSTYSKPSMKINILEETASKLDKIKFFSEIAWENKLIMTEKYTLLLEQLQVIGRQLGGW